MLSVFPTAFEKELHTKANPHYRRSFCGAVAKHLIKSRITQFFYCVGKSADTGQNYTVGRLDYILVAAYNCLFADKGKGAFKREKIANAVVNYYKR